MRHSKYATTVSAALFCAGMPLVITVFGASHSFEAQEHYVLGPVVGQGPWSGSGMVAESLEAPTGERVLYLSAGGATLELAAQDAGALYADVRLKLSASAGLEAVTEPLLEFGGSQLAFVREGDGDGVFYARVGEAWAPVSQALPLDADGVSQWLRLTIWQDHTTGTPVWDFFVDGEIASLGLPLDGAQGSSWLSILANGSAVMADDVCVGDLGSLLSQDSPDNAGGLLSMRDAGNSARAANGAAAGQNEASPQAALISENANLAMYSLQSNGAESVFYVNPATGSDAYNGLSPVAAGNGVGPKATIPGAISAAASGDVIMLCAGAHTLGVPLSATGKSVTIRTSGESASLRGGAGQ